VNRIHLLLSVCLTMTLSLRNMTLSAAEPERPNILFIMTDDQAPWALGLSGHPHARTPHMDRLFREGAYLINSFTVTPVCSPSRCSLMTSRYGSELGITDWINPQKEPDIGLAPGTLTWPAVFEKAGYATGLIGKWHLGTEDRFHPSEFGYQYFMGFRSGGNRPKDPMLEVKGQETPLKGLLPDILTDDAIAFVREHQQKPFLLSLHFRAPHAPWLPVADEDWAPFADLDPILPHPDYPKLDVERTRKVTREYLASTASVDRNLGRLMAEIDRLGLRGRTIVIYTSDHGYNMGHNGMWHKGNGHWLLTDPPPGTENVPRGQRPNMYDNSIRVPTAVRWPGAVLPETVISHTVSNMDWFPTLLSMAGLDVPVGASIRGRDVTPILKGRTIEWDNDFFAQYSTHHQSQTDMRMYRTASWKLVRDFRNPERDELFHLISDPGETTNLIGSEDPQTRAVLERLHGKLMARMDEINDPVLAEKTTP